MASRKSFRWFSLVLAGILVLSIIFTGCSGGTTAAVQPEAVAISAAGELSGTITESGSTTVQPLAEKLAGEFMAKHPEVKVVIQGGGSSVGIKATNDGTVDIGAASRELTPSDPALIKHTLAFDGIAIAVHPSNPVSNLTITQVQDIFSGKITNWSRVGGAEKAVHVAAREEGSGTRIAFEEMVMGKDTAVVKNAILQSSNGALVQVIKSDPGSIAFLSFGYLEGGVKALSIDGVAATIDNAKNGTYPVVRPLYFLTKNEPAGLVKAFIDYCTGNEARETITAEGYIPAG